MSQGLLLQRGAGGLKRDLRPGQQFDGSVYSQAQHCGHGWRCRSGFSPTSSFTSPTSCTLMPTLLAALCLLTGLFTSGLAKAEDGLGVLFNTETVRAELDAARRAAKLPPAPVAPVPEVEPPPAPPPVVEVAPPPPPQDLAVNGVVRRAQGPETVWVNGEATTGGPLLSADAAASLAEGSGTAVLLEDAQGQTMKLLPGQAVNTASLRPQEAYLAPAEGPPTAAGMITPAAPAKPVTPAQPVTPAATRIQAGSRQAP